MFRIVLSQAARLHVVEALALQHGAVLPRQAAAQTLVSLRRFSTEDSSPGTPAQPGGSAAGTPPPKGVQQWRQWVDAKIGEKLEGKTEEGKGHHGCPGFAAEMFEERSGTGLPIGDSSAWCLMGLYHIAPAQLRQQSSSPLQQPPKQPSPHH